MRLLEGWDWVDLIALAIVVAVLVKLWTVVVP